MLSHEDQSQNRYKAMQNNPEGKVTRLDDHRYPHQRERQRQVSERLMDIASREPSLAPTAVINVSVLPNGNFESIMLNVEPEHVVPALSAMRCLMVKMEAYLTAAITNRVVVIFAVAAALILVDSFSEPALAGLFQP